MSAASDNRESTTFNREQLAGSIINVIRESNSGWHPSIYEVEVGGRRAIWKDIGKSNCVIRSLMSLVLMREARVLRRLTGMASVPGLIGTAGRCGFLMEKLDAECLPRRRHNYLTPSFFDALKVEIQAMHGRGIAHGDLRRLNILVEKSTGRPKLIDFGTAVTLKKHSGPLRRTIWRKTRRIDWMHFAKIKHSYFPDQLSEDEQTWLAYAPWHYRVGHFWRWNIYKPIKRYVRAKRK